MFLVFEQHKYQNLIQTTKKKSMGPYVAKMFFLQVDEGFWLILVSDTKIFKLIFCFLILCSYRLVAELRKI